MTEWINLGYLIAIGGLAIEVWKIRRSQKERQDRQHQENVTELDAIQRTLQDINVKMGMVWRWFRKEHGMNGGDE